MQVLRRLLQAVDEGDTCVLATVAGVTGSAPRKAGTRLVVSARGVRHGTVGGGEVETAALASAAEMLAGHDSSRTLEIATNCGGVVTLMLEKFSPQRRLLVVGAGHVGKAVARAGAHAGYRVTLAAPERPELAPGAATVEFLAASDPAVLDAWEGAENTHVVIATGTAEADGAWAVAALLRPFAGIGVVGSHGKATAIRRTAAAAGVPAERLDVLRCPVGLDLGAVTPEEIAVSIVAELIRLDRTGEVPERWRRASRG
jgi:xanthine dehydrogenase accessory factor